MPIDAQKIAHTKGALLQTLHYLHDEVLCTPLDTQRIAFYVARLNHLAPDLIMHVNQDAQDLKISHALSRLNTIESLQNVHTYAAAQLKYTLRYLQLLFTPISSLHLQTYTEAMCTQLREWIDNAFTHGQLQNICVDDFSSKEPDLLGITRAQEGIIPLYFHALSLLDYIKRTISDPELNDLTRAQDIFKQLQKPLPSCSDEKLTRELSTFCHHASQLMQKQMSITAVHLVTQLSNAISHAFNQTWFKCTAKEVGESEASIQKYIALTVHTLENYIKEHFVIGEFLQNSFKNSTYFGKFTDMLAELKAIQANESLTEKQRFRDIFNRYFIEKVVAQPALATLLVDYLQQLHGQVVHKQEPQIKVDTDQQDWSISALMNTTAKGFTQVLGLFKPAPVVAPVPTTTLTSPKPL